MWAYSHLGGWADACIFSQLRAEYKLVQAARARADIHRCTRTVRCVTLAESIHGGGMVGLDARRVALGGACGESSELEVEFAGQTEAQARPRLSWRRIEVRCVSVIPSRAVKGMSITYKY